MLRLQKVLPILIIGSYFFPPYWLYIFLVGGLWAGVRSYLVNSLQKLMVYSSLFSMRWFLVVLQVNFFVGLFYTLRYFFVQRILIIHFRQLRLFFAQQISLKTLPQGIVITWFVLIGSLGGLPPTLGFYAKFRAILRILESGVSYLFLAVLLVSSLLILRFYISFCLVHVQWFKSSFFIKTWGKTTNIFEANLIIIIFPTLGLVFLLVFFFVLKTNLQELSFLRL